MKSDSAARSSKPTPRRSRTPADYRDTRLPVATLLWVVVCLFVLTPGLAHHSPALFDQNQQITIEGVVARFQWANPHVFISVDVPEEDGNSVTWTVEGSWASDLVKRGWTRDTLRPGDRVRVTGAAARDPQRRDVRGRLVSINGGPEMEFSTAQRGSDVAVAVTGRETLGRATGLVGTWLPLDGTTQLFLTDPHPFVNERGKALAEGMNLSGLNDPQANCIPFPPPANMVLVGPKAIELRGNDIVIREGSVGDVERIVRMSSTRHGRSNPADVQGDSIGRWDGDRLVVETVFNGGEEGIIATGVPFDGATKLIEHFELSPDRGLLKYTSSIENPDYLVLPLVRTVIWGYQPDLEVPRLACELENARTNIADE